MIAFSTNCTGAITSPQARGMGTVGEGEWRREGRGTEEKNLNIRGSHLTQNLTRNESWTKNHKTLRKKA